MRIIKPSTVKQWMKQHPDASANLELWLRVTLAANWGSIRDVRCNFPHADAATKASGNAVTVFNVCGNKYWLIASIKYRWRIVYTLRFMTRAEYDKDNWKARL